MDISCSAARGVLDHKDCLQCALDHGSPPCGFDYALLKSLWNDAERTGIHVTDLTGCLRRAYFDKTEPQPPYPHEQLVLWIGTAVHEKIEADLVGDPHAQSEVTLSALGLEGTTDLLYDQGRLVDFKTTRWMKPDKLPYGSHDTQVNIYKRMVEASDQTVNNLHIQYIDVSGPTKCRVHRVPVRYIPELETLACPICLYEYPTGHLGVHLTEIPVHPPEHIDPYIAERREALELALEVELPPNAEPDFLCNFCAHRGPRCPEGAEQVGA